MEMDCCSVSQQLRDFLLDNDPNDDENAEILSNSLAELDPTLFDLLSGGTEHALLNALA
jgi:hypothetical protein